MKPNQPHAVPPWWEPLASAWATWWMCVAEDWAEVWETLLGDDK